MTRSLQLGRRLPDVVPGVRREAGGVPDVVPPHDGVGNVVVREREPLLGPRVVRRALGDDPDLPELARHLLDDFRVVDHPVLELRGRRQVEEQVVPGARGRLGGHSRGQERVEDVVDLDLDVVLLSPVHAPRLVEPDVVRGNEVRPLDDRQVALEPSPLEAERPVERVAESAAGDADRHRAHPGAAKQLTTVVPPVSGGDVVGVCHIPSFP